MRIARAAALAGALLLLATPASARGRSPILATLTTPDGERPLEVADVRFVLFRTSYRHTRAPRSESPTGERLQMIERRKECRCIPFADYGRISLSKIREIEIDASPAHPVARVRVTRRNGDLREYAATDLEGGAGLFPPRILLEEDGGATREFPLVLTADGSPAWPDEMVVRILLVRTAPPRAPRQRAR